LDFGYYAEFIARSIAGLEFADCVDAYLYLGPRDSLHRENVTPRILNDQPYVEELNNRPWPFFPVDVAARRSIVTWRAKTTVGIPPISELKIQTRGARLPLGACEAWNAVILSIHRGKA